MSLNIAPGNALKISFNPSLEMIELTQQKKKNELSKILRKQNLDVIINSILQIDTMLIYNHNTIAKRKINKLRLLFPIIFAIFFVSNCEAQTITITKQMKQCKGVTKKGLQCKRLLSAKNNADYCYQHKR